jgi:hypoxanthine phosphoribosyltransferase
VEAVASARIASYGDGTSPAGPPRVVAFPSRAVLEGRTVLLVDTVVDTGRTAAAAAHAAREAGAARVVLACLADKTARRTESTTPDWRGFEAPDRFLVGYGLDAAGRWRCLPYLAALPR